MAAANIPGILHQIHNYPGKAAVSQAGRNIVELVPEICDAIMPRSRALYRRAFTDLTPTSRAIEVLNSGREVAKESLPEWSEGDRNQLIRTWEENVEMVKFAAKFASKGMMVEDAIALGHAYDVPGSLNAKQAIVQFRANPWEHVGEKVQRSRDDRREPWLSFGQMDTLAQMLNADPASPHRIIGCAVNFLAHSLADCNTTVETEMLARGVATSLRLDGDVVWHTLREHTTGDNSASSPILTQRVGSKIMSGLRDMVSAELRSAQLLAELLDTPLAKTYDVSEDDVRGVSDLAAQLLELLLHLLGRRGRGLAGTAATPLQPAQRNAQRHQQRAHQ